MAIDLTLDASPGHGQQAVTAERDGCDGARVGEVKHDPFPAPTVAATRATRTELGTPVALAFARHPIVDGLRAHPAGRGTP